MSTDIVEKLPHIIYECSAFMGEDDLRDVGGVVKEAADTISSLRQEVGKLNARIIDLCVCAFDADGKATTECMEHASLRQEVETLREALKPFVEMGEAYAIRDDYEPRAVHAIVHRIQSEKLETMIANARALLPKDKP